MTINVITITTSFVKESEYHLFPASLFSGMIITFLGRGRLTIETFINMANREDLFSKSEQVYGLLRHSDACVYCFLFADQLEIKSQ